MHRTSNLYRVPKSARAPQAHPREPSPRNVEIYSRVRQEGHSQADVARAMGISQGRVAQICGQVEAWHQWVTQLREQAGRSANRLPFSRARARRRTEHLYVLVMHSLAANPTDRRVLRLAAQISDYLCRLEEGLPAHKRFAASPAGRQLESVIDQIAAKQLRPPSSAGLPPEPAGQPRTVHELPNITDFIHDPAGRLAAATDAMQAIASALGIES